MLTKALRKIFERFWMSALYETSAGIKHRNQLISSDRTGIFSTGDVFTRPAASLLTNPDFLRDEHTLLGVPIPDTPHMALAAMLRDGKDAAHSEYVRRTAKGTLDFRPAAPVGRDFVDGLRRAFESELPIVESGNYKPVAVARVGGKEYAFDGKHRAATCAVLGIDVRCIDATLFLCDSFYHWAYRKACASKNRGHYRKHIEFFETLYGESGHGHDV